MEPLRMEKVEDVVARKELAKRNRLSEFYDMQELWKYFESPFRTKHQYLSFPDFVFAVAADGSDTHQRLAQRVLS